MSNTFNTAAANTVTAIIIKLLENNISPWHQPWTCGGAKSINGNFYRGINAILLSLLPYKDNRYLTFKRVGEFGGHVRKGEKAHPIFFFQLVTKEKKNDDGTVEKYSFPVIKTYYVFNVEQCDGLNVPECPIIQHNNPIAEAEAVWNGYKDKPELKHNASNAFYSLTGDFISIPEICQFRDSESYYATLFHEAIHSTGADNRLKRLKGNANFGSESYGREELVAEIGSQIICQSIGITKTLDNATAYCQSWAKAIKALPVTAIIQAAAQAQKAVDYILNVKFEE